MFDRRYKLYLKDKRFLLSAALSILLLGASLVVNFYAGTYATEIASNPVSDIILSNIRTYDVDGIFIFGTGLFLVVLLLICLLRPQRMPYVFKSLGLFIFIRSLFISLTHIGPFPTQIYISPASFVSKFTFGGDLFFSGHVGVPFLMALIFWDNIFLRIMFVAFSVIAAVIVLLAHMHYSIDVLAAFFITFAIYRIAEIFLKKDLVLFRDGI
jgi:hypothetical protein